MCAPWPFTLWKKSLTGIKIPEISKVEESSACLTSQGQFRSGTKSAMIIKTSQVSPMVLWNISVSSMYFWFSSISHVQRLYGALFVAYYQPVIKWKNEIFTSISLPLQRHWNFHDIFTTYDKIVILFFINLLASIQMVFMQLKKRLTCHMHYCKNIRLLRWAPRHYCISH